MNAEDHNEGRKTAPGVGDRPDYPSAISNFVDQVHSTGMLRMAAGALQVLLGLTVVLISVLGLVSPPWFSTLLTMFASVVTMVGCFFLYSLLARKGDADSLIREAIRRIMDARN